MKKRMITLISLLSLLLVWTLVSQQALLIPSPFETMLALKRIVMSGYQNISFMDHYMISMKRLGIAIGMAIVIGVPLGLLSGYNESVRYFINPMMSFYKPLPPLSYYVLVILMLGINEESKVMLLFLAALGPIYVACVSAVGSVEGKYLLSAKSLGASQMQILRTVILPASLPEVLSGVKTSISVAYTTLASAEMIAATSGLGWIVLDAYNYLKIDTVLAIIIIMGTTGIVLDIGFDWLINKIVFWKGKTL